MQYNGTYIKFKTHTQNNYALFMQTYICNKSVETQWQMINIKFRMMAASGKVERGGMLLGKVTWRASPEYVMCYLVFEIREASAAE